MVAIEVTDRPNHLLVPIHPREVCGHQLLVDVLKADLPRISGGLQQPLNLDLDITLFMVARAVFEVLDLLRELRTTTGFCIQPRCRNVVDRHTGHVKRIEEKTVSSAIGRHITPAKHLQRTTLATLTLALTPTTAPSCDDARNRGSGNGTPNALRLIA